MNSTLANSFVNKKNNYKKIGTIKGVFIPNILQMIGVILFMRLGWILGNVGIFKLSTIIVLSSTLLFITTLSMTAVVSNMKMKGGGSYYLISRMLGIEFGSAIGILLCISLLASITLCISGFCASLHQFLPHIPINLLKISTLLILILISYISTNLALKAQVLIFVTLVISIIAIFTGSKTMIPETIQPLNIPPTLTFWMAFSMFFPATTGIEAGMSLSGDLKNPSKSLPLGTIAAVLTAFVLYFSMSLFLNKALSKEMLLSHPFLVYYFAKYKFLVVLGVWAATLSSALGSILGAPRILQAIAIDGILPSFLKKGHGKANIPRPAIIIVFILAAILLLLTNINQIIPILTMSCLVSYGIINFVAFFEEFVQNPSWRPTFRTHWLTSLTGACGCLVIMLIINPGATFIVLTATVLLFIWISKKNIESNWDDIRYSLVSYIIYKSTTKLITLEKNAKSWRPHILALSKNNEIPKTLAHFSNSLNQKKRFLTFGIPLVLEKENLNATLINMSLSMKDTLKKHKISSHIHINPMKSKDPLKGMSQIIKNYGFGPVKPNTIIITLDKSIYQNHYFYNFLTNTNALQKNIILLKTDQETSSFFYEKSKKKKQINLWWKGKYFANFKLSLAFSHIMQKSKVWKDAKICIKTIVADSKKKEEATKYYENYYNKMRINNLGFEAIIDPEMKFISNIIKHSEKAALTFIGLKTPKDNQSKENYISYYENFFTKTSLIPNIAYVLAGENLDFEKIFI